MEDTLHYPPPWKLYGEGFIIPFLANEKEIIKNGFLTEEDKNEYAGGFGACMIVNYESSDVGPYFELLFIPGDFKYKDPLKSKPKLHKRISKIYVSSEMSIQEGRRNWAIPKEYANFKWTKDKNTTGITITTKDNQNILDANFTKILFPFPVTTKIYPVSLLQKSEANQFIRTKFSGHGKAYFSKINNLSSNEKFFVDINKNSKFHFGLSVNEFNITFPIRVFF